MNLDKIRIYLATAREDMDELYEEIWVPTHAEGVLDVADKLLKDNAELREALKAWGEHDERCRALNFASDPCSCGLDEIIEGR